jgi:hypothetical protein
MIIIIPIYVRESFNEYKKTLELNLMGITYLYDGDAISSTDESYSEIKTTPLTSPTFIITTIIKIYNESIKNMISKSKEIIIPEESITKSTVFGGNILDKLTEMGIKPLYIFVSKKGSKLFGITKKPEINRAFPGYFYNIERFIGLHLDIFYSPLVVEEDGESVLYVTDKSFQSLVYSIQNMDYKIIPQNEINGDKPYNEIEWLHTLDYKLYDCSYNSYKIIIKNVSKIREDKINQILDGN